MPEMPTPNAGAAQPPQQAQGMTQGQPQFGSSPVTGPTQNRGFQAAGLQKLGVALKILEETIPLLGAVSDPGKDVLQAVQRLSKHIQPGQVSPAAEKQTLSALMTKAAQAGPQIAAMRAMGAGGGAGAGGAAPPAAA